MANFPSQSIINEGLGLTGINNMIGSLGGIGSNGYSQGNSYGSSQGYSSGQSYASTLGTGQTAMDFENAQAERAMQFSREEAEKDRAWQEGMSSTAFQRAVIDMKKAGINPILAAGSQASTGQGAMASSSMGRGHTDSESWSVQQAAQSATSSAESYSEMASGLSALVNGIKNLFGEQQKKGKESTGSKPSTPPATIKKAVSNIQKTANTLGKSAINSAAALLR